MSRRALITPLRGLGSRRIRFKVMCLKTATLCAAWPVRALCVETHETWLEDNRYLNMALLAEQKKEQLRLAA